jgi:AcrR family transcriptional regulator
MASAWKDREVKRREEEILVVARKILLEHGYFGMTMDRIAAGIEYSKGTLYHHFGSKEDVLSAIAIQTEAKRMEYFERAAKFVGNPRERMTAIGVGYELYYRLHPAYFQSEQLIHQQDIFAKISEERRALILQNAVCCHAIMDEIIDSGVKSGDLELPEWCPAPTLGFLLWSLTSGGFSNLANEQALDQMGIVNGLEAIRLSCQVFLDGFGWKPLTKDHDYTTVGRRVCAEIFPQETAEAVLQAAA